MWRYLSKSILLLLVLVVICCVLYPLVLWVIGQVAFPFQANGNLLRGPDGKPVGSRLIAQPFTKDEYFQPRPSAASYDASASTSSSLAASNYALRDRVARTLGPIAKYRSGPKAGQLVAPDIENWFQKDIFQGKPHIVGQWANLHNSLAQAWVKADPQNGAYVDSWAKAHPIIVAQWIKGNPGTPQPKADDLAVVFFENFSKDNPGKFPSAVTHTRADGKTKTTIEPVKDGSDIQSIFFDMWRQDHPQADIEDVPGDLVTTSGSGLDPHITFQNAEYQLDRVASKWVANLKRDPSAVRKEIEQILQENASAPWFGLAGEKLVNVLEVNLELRKRYGAPSP
ncbi:MAG TPA: potassium-transporting ATPase subunit C [Thermodesulfobacteriota bacterium]|nr:potassium-transporting ATPase subunit C [Thermodesulfobacteriota bacterium]